MRSLAKCLNQTFVPLKILTGEAWQVRPKVARRLWLRAAQHKRLGVDYIDIYRPGRLDPNVPIEDTVGAIGELVKAGYVRAIGLFEVGPGGCSQGSS